MDRQDRQYFERHGAAMSGQAEALAEQYGIDIKEMNDTFDALMESLIHNGKEYIVNDEIYEKAVTLAEKNGLYQFLELKKTWISEEGYYCAYFIAEYSDSGVYLEAQSMDVYDLAFKNSIYTENFAGLDYRTIEIDEQKVAETEEILLRNGINESNGNYRRRRRT